VTMDRKELGGADSGAFDWDAAFEAIVAPLRLPRHRRVARAVGSVVLAAALLGVTWILLLQMVAAQARGLAYLMR
jgi:hypothetical protein